MISRTPYRVTPLAKRITLLLAAVFICAIPLGAQTVTFSGHVTEQANGQPVSGVAVVAEGDQTGTRVAVTDAQGKYTLPFGANTSIRLRAYKTNYIFNPVLVMIFTSGGFPILGPFPQDFAGTSFPILVFAKPPALLTEDDSLNALTLDTVTHTRDPFAVTTDSYPGSDKRTRLTLLLVDLDIYPNQGETLTGVVSVQAQNGQTTYTLTPEDLRKVPDVPWMSQLTVRVPAELSGVANALVTVTARSQVSKAAQVKFK